MEPMEALETRPLRKQGATLIQRAMLDAAHADVPNKDLAPRLLASLSALVPVGMGVELRIVGDDSVPTLGQVATAGYPGRSPLVTWAKLGKTVWKLVRKTGKVGKTGKTGMVGGIIGLGLSGGAMLAHSLHQRYAEAVISSPVAQSAPVESGRSVSLSQIEAEWPPAEGPVPRDESPPARGRSGVVPRGARAPAHDRATVPDPTSTLAAEIRTIDSARVALDGHDGAAALRVLQDYHRTYPHGLLQPEATVLRLAALVEQRDAGSARGLATNLLADPSYKTYEARIRSLLRRLGTR